METMSYREKKRKSLKGPIFAISSFLAIGTGIITYAMINEQEPVVIGNSGSLLTGSIPVVEENALINMSIEDIQNMYEIKINYTSDKENEKLKADISITFVYIDEAPLEEFNNTLNKKFLDNYAAFKENMASVEHNFTYKVYYNEHTSVVKDNAILSLIMKEKMLEDETSTQSMRKVYTYNIDLLTGEVLAQSDIIVDILGASYKDVIKNAIYDYVDEKDMLPKKNFYLDDGKLHFLFNSGDLVDKKYGSLDIIIENKQKSTVDIYDEEN